MTELHGSGSTVLAQGTGESNGPMNGLKILILI
jgi:hypothetical protein